MNYNEGDKVLILDNSEMTSFYKGEIVEIVERLSQMYKLKNEFGFCHMAHPSEFEKV